VPSEPRKRYSQSKIFPAASVRAHSSLERGGVVWVDDRLPAEAVRLLERETGVFVPSAVEIIGLAVAGIGPNELGHGVHERAQALLGAVELFDTFDCAF
jgi:hypothetical protein